MAANLSWGMASQLLPIKRLIEINLVAIAQLVDAGSPEQV